MKRWLWWIPPVVILCTLVCATIWYSQQNIVLRLPNGFFPEVVRMEVSGPIRFVNLTSRPIWPAAGPHPTHTSYADFDPKEGIDPWHSWVFDFQREGTFTFHDHFAPQISGIVVVGSNDVSKVDDQGTCLAIENMGEQAACIEIYFKKFTETNSFPESLATFIDITSRYPGSCHTFAHDLGKSAYASYLEGSLPHIGQESSACGFGFWHGFTAAMQTRSGLEASKDFCASLDGNTAIQVEMNRMNCYHGIGIGLVPDPPPEHLWGVFQPIVDPALAFCDTVPNESFYRERCLTGAFHAVTIYMETKLYGFAFNEDTLHYCAQQAIGHQRACFLTLVAALPSYTNFDLSQTLAILQKTTPADLLAEVFHYAAIIFVDAAAPIDETGRFIQECDSLNSDYRTLCILAAINKFYNNSMPGTEYKHAVALCSSEWIHESERASCFDEVLSYSSRVYTQEMIHDVCASIPQTNRSLLEAC